MSCLGAPACGVDVRVVGINPEVIAVTPAIKVELGKKGPRGVKCCSWSPAQSGGPLGSEVPSMPRPRSWRRLIQGPSAQ